MTQETWADRFVRLIGRFVPDAISAAIFLLFFLFLAALLIGNDFEKTMDAWYRGLWMLLPFTMQMTLIIVLSSVLGQTAVFRNSVRKLSSLPKTTNQVVACAVLLNAALSYFYWGLGLALGPIIAVYFAREAERKKIQVDFLFLLATVWAANAVWQFGFSASAPLLMATPGHFLEGTVGILPLSSTIWSPAAIIHEIAFTIALITVGCLLMPKNRRPLSMFPEANKLAQPVEQAAEAAQNFSERLERNSIMAILLSIALLAWLYFHFITKGLGLDINSLNVILLFLCFAMHRNVNSFTGALQHAVLSSWPLIVIYHLYAGIAGLIQYTTLGEKLGGNGRVHLDALYISAAGGVDGDSGCVLHPVQRRTMGDSGLRHLKSRNGCRSNRSARTAGAERRRPYGQSHDPILGDDHRRHCPCQFS